MANSNCILIASLAVLGFALHAASPVATVTGSEPFLLRGTQVPVAGTPKWPVMPGDEIVAQMAPVHLTFKDGSKATLGQSSRARVEMEGETPVLRLLQGVSDYSLRAMSSVRIYTGSQSVVPSELVGSVKIGAAEERTSALPPKSNACPHPPPYTPPCGPPQNPPPVSRRR